MVIKSRMGRTAHIKVKCTLVQALRLCTGHTAHRGSRGIALLFHDHGTRRGWRVSVTPRLLFTHGKDQVPIVKEAGWAPGLVWTGAENLANGIWSPDRPARSQSLYWLRYPAHIQHTQHTNISEVQRVNTVLARKSEWMMLAQLDLKRSYRKKLSRDYTHPAQDRNQRQTHINSVMNFKLL